MKKKLLLFIALLLLVALCAPLISPYNPYDTASIDIIEQGNRIGGAPIKPDIVIAVTIELNQINIIA